MKEEVKRWLDKSEDDLDKAEILFKHRKYDGTVFFCQQAVEKALKALSLEKKNKIRKIHDLTELGKDVNLPDNLLDYCKELTLSYIYSRYPDIKEEKNINVISKSFLNYSKKILKWIKEKI